MKAKELMIGDWLSYVDTFGEKVVGNVTDLTKNVGYEIVAVDNCHYDSRTNDDFSIIEPIPLTPEILEANGFRNEDDIWFSKDYDYGIDNQIGLMEFFKYDGEFVEAKIPRCFYTHQFQHALRLCGLSEMADNFKLTKKGDNDNE